MAQKEDAAGHFSAAWGLGTEGLSKFVVVKGELNKFCLDFKGFSFVYSHPKKRG